jgi:MFS superfamily sulfate permease-like transporter
MIKKVFPFLSWVKEIKAATLQADFIAGITVALVLVPQSMAYAQLAGMPVPCCHRCWLRCSVPAGSSLPAR